VALLESGGNDGQAVREAGSLQSLFDAVAGEADAAGIAVAQSGGHLGGAKPGLRSAQVRGAAIARAMSSQRRPGDQRVRSQAKCFATTLATCPMLGRD